MLTPDYLDTLPDALVVLWQQVEDDILRDVARRIGKLADGGAPTETAVWQLWRYQQAQALHQDVVSLLARYSGKSDAEIRRILQAAGTETLAADDALYQALGFSPSDINSSPALLNLLNAGYRQTAGTWQNLTATTANTVTRQFENALDRAWLQTSSGAFDYKTAIKRAVDGLAADGLKAVTYPSGHTDTLEVAVRRAVLTGVNQTAAKLQLARMEEMDCEFVEVTAHGGARSDGSQGPADHAWWQGKVYHIGGDVWLDGVFYPDFATATGYGTGEGLCGWNCRHNFFPFWPGISVRAYTDAALEALNARDIPYQGKLYTRYEISQMQRALERKVRRAKRIFLAEDAAGLDTGAAAVKLKAARQSLAQFVQATGGRQDSARESVSGFGRSAAGKATWKNRQITNDAAKYFNTGNSGADVSAYLKEKPTIDLLSSHGIKFIYRISDKEILVDAGHPTITDLTGHAADNLLTKPDRMGMTMEQAQAFVDASKITLYQCERETLKFIADNGYAVLNFSQELVTAVPQKWRKKYDKYLSRKDVNP